VLHATRALRASIEHAHQLLAPGGSLVLVETTRASWALELTFGLIDGWWRFNDFDLRPHQPLLNPAAWRDVLKKAGLHSTYACPCDPRGQQSLIWAEAAQPDHPPRWLLLGTESELGPALALAIHDHGGTAVLADDFAAEHDSSPPAAPGARPWDYIVDLTALGRGRHNVPGASIRQFFPDASIWTVTASGMRANELPSPREPHADSVDGQIDLDHMTADRAALAVLCAIETCGASHEIAIRDGRILVPRGRAESLGIPVATPAVDEPLADAASAGHNVAASTPLHLDFAQRFAAAFPAERPAILVSRLTKLTAAILKLPVAAIDPERGLQDQGMDSLMALELRGQLQHLTSARLPTTLALERPSIRSLTEYLLPLLAQVPEQVGSARLRSARTAVAPVTTQELSSEAVAEPDLPSFIAHLARLGDDEAYRRLLTSGGRT
jgi:acyl carrier protein